MSYWGFVDESGTLAEQKVMTVSLVLVDGSRTADRINERILKDLHPHLAKDLKVLMKKNLHFVDMSESEQSRAAKILAKEKIAAVINSHWHSGEDEPYEVIFGRYTRMVQNILYKGLEFTSGDLNLVIAQQGGWETYEHNFLEEVGKAVLLFRQRQKAYRKVDMQLKPAHQIRGLQLADFYAGSGRKMLLERLDGSEGASSPYDQVEHQVRWQDYLDL